MLSQTAVNCAAITIIAAILISAGVSDVRTRRVRDLHWSLLLLIGIPLAAVSIGADHGQEAAVFYAIAAMMLGLYLLSPLFFGASAAMLFLSSGFAISMAIREGAGVECLAAFCQFAIFVGLHLAGQLTGGADAKCLASLSLVLPAWSGPGTPFIVLSVALVALVMAVAWVPVVSRMRGGRGCSYPRAVADIDATTEWPTGWEYGGVASTCRPSYDHAEETVHCLRDLGVPEARVTPVIPFVAFVAVAFAMLATCQFLI